MHRTAYKKTFRILSLFLLVELVFSTTPVALAISIPSASQVASDLEQRYNLNLGAIREQGQQFNVSDQKKIAPEASVYFSPSDPKPGEEIMAIALPIYFANGEDQLYFTWYLKRAGCSLGQGAPARCDLNKDGRVTVEDWKIEAMRILASNNFDYVTAFNNGGYDSDNDSDGYKARFGGDNKVNAPNYCYYHDNASGENYEMISGPASSSVSFDCSGNLQPVCMDTNQTVDSTGGTTTSASGSLSVSGYPTCSASGATCSVGTPCCVTDPTNATTCEEVLSSCTPSTVADANPSCQHLFPNAPGATTGDGAFGAREENFWQTDSHDPDTADNGSKDEANVSGLDSSRFKWNYLDGDMIGVVIEGTTVVMTKHDDSSSMIMWAFSNNDCPLSNASGTGSYSQRIRGYSVVFPTIKIDLNSCLERNLIDPTKGGQATNLEVHVAANPTAPLDDMSGKDDGDTLEVAATVDNSAKKLADTFYDWKVQLSPDGTPNPSGNWIDITSALNNLSDGRKLLSSVRGIGVNTINLRLNMRANDQFGGTNPQAFSSFLNGNDGYLRFFVDVRENFNSSGAVRKGRGSVLVRFFTVEDQVRAYIVNVNGDPATVSLSGQEICTGTTTSENPAQQALAKLEAKVCRVIENEIVGLSVDNSNGVYSNFNWTINGKPLVCNTKVSSQCFDDRQGNISFFPVVGSPDDTSTITLTANKIDLQTSTEKTVTLSRVFKIVKPTVEIVSTDSNVVWPKVLGEYRDANGKLFPDYSKMTLQTFPGSTVVLEANFIPNFLGSLLYPRLERAWTIDDVPIGNGTTSQISFTANKPDGSIYNIAIAAVYRPSDLIRKALSDIWGISVLDSPEQYFSATTQLEHAPNASLARLQGPQKYLALLSSYLPASLLFSLRVMLSIGLILFVAGLAHTFTRVPARARP
ncbi:MAG: hypothetical protein ABI747_01680 [Candidatus Moraniibacteriota bacterium]